MRATRPLLVLAVAAALTLAGCTSRRESEATPPRLVVLISIDTLRPDHLGAYGYARPTSPALDALAQSGAVFDDAMAPSPWTLPSHASLLTGLYPSRHGLKSHEVRLPETVVTLAAELGRHGWATAAVVNSQNLSERHGLERGFQDFLYVKESVTQRAPSRVLVDQALQWLGRPRDRPLFLFVHTYDAHSDYHSLPEYEAMFVRPYAGPADGSTNQLLLFRVGRFGLDAADAQHLIDLYDAGIRQVDDEMGRLLRAIPAREALVVITSDHGEEFLEHGGVMHGRTQYQEVVRVPLLVRGDGIPAGTRVATPVSLVDLMPTILGRVGVPVPDGLDGKDLAPLWHGRGAELATRVLYGEADHNNVQLDITRAVRRGGDKLHFNRLTGATTLFDLTADPGERSDVAPARPTVLAGLRELLDAFLLVKHAPTQPASLNAEQVERLKSLGYAR
jgi:arylsulfatase A-like enzyme